MTKPFSALVAALVLAGFSHGAAAQSGPSASEVVLWQTNTIMPVDVFPLIRPDWPGQPQPLTQVAPTELLAAELPDSLLERGAVDPAHLAMMRWSSTRPESWGDDSAPYRVALPGPSYVGVIPSPIPEGWVVTNLCLEWDPYYANDERPHGDCTVFQMRPIVVTWLNTP